MRQQLSRSEKSQVVRYGLGAPVNLAGAICAAIVSHQSDHAQRSKRIVTGIGRIIAPLLLAALIGGATAHADTGDDLLDGSTHALILGPTGIPNPATRLLPGYIPTVNRLYLQPLGFPAGGTITPLVTPETPWFGRSIAKGEAVLTQAVETAFDNGELSARDPLTIVTYSQSTVIASLAEPILHQYGIPSGDLRFVMLGDAAANPSSGPTGILDTFGNSPFGEAIFNLLGWSNLIDATTPNDLYPTDVYTVVGDFWADYPQSAQRLWVPGLLQHGDYLGLSESDIQGALPTVDGLTTYYTIADPAHLGAILLTTARNDFGL
jgi:PE-PPE domain